MSNHYHLAIETPKANLADGMHWLQSTFSTRFNRLRAENGHLFQGRYKSLLVDSNRLGPLCHYIHLNPVRAKLCTIEELADWRWTSLLWLMQPKQRATWYCPEVALGHAGELSDSAAGRKSYGNYLAWLSEDEPAPWKVAMGAAMEQKSTATNRWLSENLYLGNLHEVSRKISRWLRAPDRGLARKLSIAPNPMA